MMVKKNERKYVNYLCEYCHRGYLRDEQDAIACEKSHTPVGVGSRVEYTETMHINDHGHPYEQSYGVEGTIIKEKDGKFLIERDDGSRKWKHTWEIYRMMKGSEE